MLGALEGGEGVRVLAIADRRNLASKALLERLGFGRVDDHYSRAL